MLNFCILTTKNKTTNLIIKQQNLLKLMSRKHSSSEQRNKKNKHSLANNTGTAQNCMATFQVQMKKYNVPGFGNVNLVVPLLSQLLRGKWKTFPITQLCATSCCCCCCWCLGNCFSAKHKQHTFNIPLIHICTIKKL